MKQILYIAVAFLLFNGCTVVHFKGSPEDLKKLSREEVVDFVAANAVNKDESEFMIGYVKVNEKGNALNCHRWYESKDKLLLDEDLMKADLWLLRTTTTRHVFSVESKFCVLYFFNDKVGYVSYTGFEEF